MTQGQYFQNQGGYFNQFYKKPNQCATALPKVPPVPPQRFARKGQFSRKSGSPVGGVTVQVICPNPYNGFIGPDIIIRLNPIDPFRPYQYIIPGVPGQYYPVTPLAPGPFFQSGPGINP